MEIENQVARMLLLPENSYQYWVLHSIKVLSNAILRVNEEFLDIKMLLRASLYNIANKGAGPGDATPSPWKAIQCFYRLPYEFSKETSISHLKLADGDAAADGNSDDKFAELISTKLGFFPFCKLPLPASTSLSYSTKCPHVQLPFLHGR